MVGHSNHQPLTIKQQVHSDDRRSMVGHSNHQPLTIEQHAHSDDRRLMVGHSNHQPLTIKQQVHSDDRRLMVGRSYNSPSSGVRTLMIEVARWKEVIMMSRLCNDWQLMLIEQKKSYVFSVTCHFLDFLI